MSFFSAAEMADLAAVHVLTFDRMCALVTPGAMTSDGAGGETEGTPSSVTVACRIDPAGAIDQQIAERLGQTVDAVVTLPLGTVVTDTQRIEAQDGGAVYEVVSTNTDPDQSWRTAVQALVRRIR